MHSDVSFWHQRQRLNISTKTSISTIQHPRLPLSEPRSMTVSIEVNVDPPVFRIYGELHIIGGEYHGKTEFIPRITLLLTEDDAKFSFKLKRCQFSVRLAFSILITKLRANPSNASAGLPFESRLSLAGNCMWRSPRQQAAEMSRSSSP